MRTLFGLVVLSSACALLGACGGDSSGDQTCAFQGALSGAVTWQSDSAAPACVIPFSSSSSGGVEMDFRPLQAPISQLVVNVSSVKAEMTGPFPASAEVRLPDNRKWTTAAAACTVTVESSTYVQTQEFGGKRYQLTGRGECAAAAMPQSPATGTVTIAPFTFRFPAQFL